MPAEIDLVPPNQSKRCLERLPLYDDEMPLFEKIEAVAKRIYRASEVIVDKSVRGHTVPVREARLSAGAGLFVVITGRA